VRRDKRGSLAYLARPYVSPDARSGGLPLGHQARWNPHSQRYGALQVEGRQSRQPSIPAERRGSKDARAFFKRH
jgi:hypothetical protein